MLHAKADAFEPLKNLLKMATGSLVTKPPLPGRSPKPSRESVDRRSIADVGCESAVLFLSTFASDDHVTLVISTLVTVLLTTRHEE